MKFSLDWHDEYVALRDPSEYKAAMRFAGSWAAWVAMREKHASTLDLWASEVDALLRSEAIEAIKAHAQAPGGTAAAKWLAEGQWKPKGAVGRPKKEKEQPAEDTQRILEDVKRLRVVK
jgi:hypothetical protein